MQEKKSYWTAMILGFLPYKVPQNHERKNFGWMRYLTFLLSFVFVGALFLCQVGNIERIMFLGLFVNMPVPSRYF